MTAAVRNGARLAGAAAGALLTLTAVAAAPAQAAGYRYWSYWESDGGKPWAYATQGPATARPAEGDAIGFRFAISSGTDDTSLPSAAPDFAKICGGVEQKDGTKRVAVVLDFGGPADAPPGDTPPAKPVQVGCAQVREDATSAEALATVAKPLRYDSAAMLCGIMRLPGAGLRRAGRGEGPGVGGAHLVGFDGRERRGPVPRRARRRGGRPRPGRCGGLEGPPSRMSPV